jgi:hypothetical protein
MKLNLIAWFKSHVHTVDCFLLLRTYISTLYSEVTL